MRSVDSDRKLCIRKHHDATRCHVRQLIGLSCRSRPPECAETRSALFSQRIRRWEPKVRQVFPIDDRSDLLWLAA